MLICIGAATRLVEMLQQPSKSYRTKICLGARSDTLDADGRITFEPSARAPSAEEVKSALVPLVGEVLQKPPDYSALKIQGRRADDLARAGRALELAPRTVRIDEIAVLGYAWPHVELEVVCGSGTYIRSIARDLGEALACGGYVASLVRTRIGPFLLEHALDASALSTESIQRHLRPALDAVAGLPRLVLESHELEAITHGRRLTAQPARSAHGARPGRIARLRGEAGGPGRGRSRGRMASSAKSSGLRLPSCRAHSYSS